MATLRFRNGALGIIEATTAARSVDLEGSLSILGKKGAVEIAGFAMNQIRHWCFVDELSSDREVIEKFSVNPPNVYGFGHQAYYQHVVDCLADRGAALVDGLQGRRGGSGFPLYAASQPAWCRLVNRPLLHQTGIRDDVAFGARVKVVEPCHVYGCRIG